MLGPGRIGAHGVACEQMTVTRDVAIMFGQSFRKKMAALIVGHKI
jgi:hypothetical protein